MDFFKCSIIYSAVPVQLKWGWIRIRIENGLDLGYNDFVDPDWKSGSRNRIQWHKNEGKNVHMNKFYFLFITERHFKKIFSSKVLLWNRIHIGSGFNDFMDPDPYPKPELR
jgi:hypothetical protein